MMTFREKTTHLLRRLRRIQMVSLILLLVGFVLPFFWMGEQCHVVWKNTDAHRPHGRILLLGEGQTDQMPPMRKKSEISAFRSIVFQDKRCAFSAKGTAARHPLLPVLQGGFW